MRFFYEIPMTIDDDTDANHSRISRSARSNRKKNIKAPFFILARKSNSSFACHNLLKSLFENGDTRNYRTRFVFAEIFKRKQTTCEPSIYHAQAWSPSPHSSRFYIRPSVSQSSYSRPGSKPEIWPVVCQHEIQRLSSGTSVFFRKRKKKFIKLMMELMAWPSDSDERVKSKMASVADNLVWWIFFSKLLFCYKKHLDRQ